MADVLRLINHTDFKSTEWYVLAEIASRASGKSTGKQEEYAALAVELLRRAFAKGWRTDPDDGEGNPVFDPLRQREDFKALVAELRAEARKPPEIAPSPRERR